MPLLPLRNRCASHALVINLLLALSSLAAGSRAATAAPDAVAGLEILPDFKLDLILAPDRSEKISFISLTKDNKGRLLVGGQRGQSIRRLTLQDGKVVKQESLKLPISEAMGMLYAFDSLYIDGAQNGNFGLYRCRDTKGEDQFDSVEKLRSWPGGAGDHGAHAIVLGPDKKIYTICGNFTQIPVDRVAASPVVNYQDDRCLPRAEDGNGFGAGKKPPGGFITRMDPDGKNAELFAAGERNTYDFAFNADGELFGFDSDMEWDWGTPWYRPIRIFHAPSGADQGFREGSAKWPTYYADSLPPVVENGIGCPTGVAFGYGAKFPAKYQKAIYVLDWTYGRVIAAHLRPKGATYEATFENFIAPRGLHAIGAKQPNNVTDIVIGDDGALYFTTGGRDTQPQLFRVTYSGSESTAPAELHDADGADARDLRHQLEVFHGHTDPKAVATAWPHLASEDRFIRYAARLAIESQPVEEWKSRALSDTSVRGALTALLSLARLGSNDDQPPLLTALDRIPQSSLSPEQQLDRLRVLEVSFSRHGIPAPEQAARLIAALDPLYPAQSDEMNCELCQVLLALQAPDAVAKTMKLLTDAPTQEQQVGYALYLRSATVGWTPQLRQQFFNWFVNKPGSGHHPDYVTKWFADAGRPYSDGSSYNNFIAHLHEDAVKTLSPEEKTSLATILDAYKAPAPKAPKPAKPRKLVQEWKMEDLEPGLAEVGHGRDFAHGKKIFEEAQCTACHRFGNDGGAVGPDLTAVSSRFGRRDILESIILPSKVISGQYADTTVRLKSGDVVNGRIMQESDTQLVFRPNPLKPDQVTVQKADVSVRKLSKTSPMPEGLVNTFTQDEILDLIAYLESAGNSGRPDFKR